MTPVDQPIENPVGTLGTDGPLRVDGPAPGTEPAFDSHNPPSAELIADCVHCGFCLPTCPTYVLWGQEMDSPRGRIYLMNEGISGEPLTDKMVEHFDACLGCMACVTACPSGVQYGRLIEQTRAQVERRHKRKPSEVALRKAIFSVFPYPKRLRALRGPLKVYQRSGLPKVVRGSGLLAKIAPRLAAMEAIAPPLTTSEPVPERTPAVGTRRGTVGMLLGCVQREFFPGVNAATARVLAAEGYDVVAPAKQGCCGALSEHSGYSSDAQEFARKLIDVFDATGVDVIVVNAAGCGSTMKEYAEILAEDPGYAERAKAFSARTQDISEFLAAIDPVAPRHPLELTVAYHDACHLGHAQGIKLQPRALLTAIPGLVVKEIGEGEICCGSAGIYNVLHPKTAQELGDRKAGHVIATGAQLLVTANPGCLMQIGSSVNRLGEHLAYRHIVEVLDASISGQSAASLLT